MDSIRNYDTSEAENDTDTDCSPSETWLQLLGNQLRSVYLLAVSKNNFHACRHVAQRFTTIWAFSVFGKDLFLNISLFPTVNKNLPWQRSSQNEKNSTCYVLYNGLHLKHWIHSIIPQRPLVNRCKPFGNRHFKNNVLCLSRLLCTISRTHNSLGWRNVLA